MQVWSLDREDPLEDEMATHSSNLDRKIPRRVEPAELQYKELQEPDMIKHWAHYYPCFI